MICLKCLTKINNSKSACYGLHAACFAEWFNTPSDAQFTGLQRRASARSSDSQMLLSENCSFFHGKFKKYTAELNGYAYILKMREIEAPELPEVEYVCNQIGKQLGIPVAEFYYIRFNNEPVFVTKNFIHNGTLTDLQHIYHFRAGDQHNCDTLIRIISEKTKQPRDIAVFVKTILFDALIGNHDRHGRNLGFLASSNHLSLAPIYDNVSYLSLEKGDMLQADFNPTGKIRTRSSHEPSMVDYVIELKKLGYHKECLCFYRKIKWLEIEKLIDGSFCSQLMKVAIKKLIQKRIKELENALSD